MEFKLSKNVYPFLSRRIRSIAVVAAVVLAAPAQAGQADRPSLLHLASDGDALSLDPYTRNELQQLGLLGNIYESLVRFDGQGNLQPGLAIRWEASSPLDWTFHLRQNVKWQDGSGFAADDVVFSLHRVQSPTSLLRPMLGAVIDATRLDDLTVVFHTSKPDPILPREMAIWYIMSKAWCEAHDAAQPALLAEAHENFATRHAMGTGPFTVVRREPEQVTELAENPLWWDHKDDFPKNVVYETIPADGTRVAALLAGDVDLITNVPPLNVARVENTDGLAVESHTELRTIFLGMDQWRDHLVDSGGTDRNPFRDRRVREAVALAIDEDAIANKLMHGLARPTWLLWGPGVQGYDATLDHRPPVDLPRARALLKDAGYPDGFAVTLDCPNDRYLMDEQICTALAPMLAHIGIKIRLNIMPKARFFAQIGPPGYHTSFYLLGWTPTTLDAHNALMNLLETRQGTRGAVNFGGFSDPRIDALTEKIASEMSGSARDELISEAARIAQEDFAYIPLHQQELLWGMRRNIQAGQFPDGMIRLRLVHIH